MRSNLKFLLMIIFVILGFWGSEAFAQIPFQKGICYVAWEKERYLSEASDESLANLAKTGASWVSVVTTYYQNTYDSKDIFPTDKTPSDKSLMHAINQAHKLGLKVMLKPHIDLLDTSDGLWRADIGFQKYQDWQEWFGQYLNFILHYAALAQKARVEIFCIGTELAFASTKTEFWEEQVIPKVRQVYSGKLIYSANWDEYKKIRFWNSLDYIGVDAYFPLTEEKSPEYEEIKSSWIKWADDIAGWQSKIGKPIIFTEIGYSSCELTAAKPWESHYGKKLDLKIQADCYNAALDVLSSRSWCGGIYWWYWRSSAKAGGINNRDFTPQNKPAEIVLSYWYSGLSFNQLSR